MPCGGMGASRPTSEVVLSAAANGMVSVSVTVFMSNGSGSLAVYESLLDSYGPDSTAGTIASVLQGSSETTFYTIALYYGTCGIRNGRHTLLCALCGDCTAFLCSCLCIRLFG